MAQASGFVPEATLYYQIGVDEFLDFRRQEGISGYVVGLGEVYSRLIFRDMGADLRDSPEVPRDQPGTSSATKWKRVSRYCRVQSMVTATA